MAGQIHNPSSGPIHQPSDPSRDQRRAVIENELRWHDEEAHRRHFLDHLLYDPPAFDAVVAQQMDFLALQPGERVLDMGCGPGKETLELSRRGQQVVSIDLSHVQLSEARAAVLGQHATAHVAFVQANAEELPFADGAFRVVYGKAVLHHLDLTIAADEVRRVLQPAGRASFAEPLVDHPMIQLGRRLTPRLRTRDEHPLSFAELERFGRAFPRSVVHVSFLVAPLAYPFRLLPQTESLFRRIHRFLRQIDRRLFGLGRRVQRLAWYGVVNVTREQ